MGRRRRTRNALIALAGGFLYGSLNLLYACVPYISLEAATQARLLDKIRTINEALNNTDIGIADAFDATLFALALLLKFFLFIGALIFVQQSIFQLRPSAVPHSFDEGTLLGILADTAYNLDADFAEICFELPARGREQRPTAWYRWYKAKPDKIKPSFEVMTDILTPEESVVGHVLATSEPLEAKDLDQFIRDKKGVGYLKHAPNMHSFRATPILVNESTIGCLNLEWSELAAYTATTILKAEELTNILGPIIQTHRELAAIEVCSKELSTLKQKKEAALEPTRETRLNETLQQIASIVSEIYGVSTIGLSLDLGFRPTWVIMQNGRIETATRPIAPSALCIKRHVETTEQVQPSSSPEDRGRDSPWNSRAQKNQTRQSLIFRSAPTNISEL